MKKTSTFDQFKKNKKLTNQEKKSTQGGYKHYQPEHSPLTLNWIEIDLRRPVVGGDRNLNFAPAPGTNNAPTPGMNDSLESILFGQP